ncbi:hypothetical protein V8D89_002213 [Ganoderma adspersum]
MPPALTLLDEFAITELSGFVTAIVEETHEYTCPPSDDEHMASDPPDETSFITSEFLLRVRALPPQSCVDALFIKLYRYLQSKPDASPENLLGFRNEYAVTTGRRRTMHSIQNFVVSFNAADIASNRFERALAAYSKKKTEKTGAALRRADRKLTSANEHLDICLEAAADAISNLRTVLRGGTPWPDFDEE